MATAIQVPKSQARNSSTFTQPPLDESLSLPAIYDWQATHSPDHPLFLFEDGPKDFRTITYKEGVQGMQRATKYVRDLVNLPRNALHAGKPPVIAILASTDTVTYYSFIMGAMRTGWTIFPISPRNSPPAIANLLSLTKARHFFVSAEAALQDLATASISALSEHEPVEKLDMPDFADLFRDTVFDPSFDSVPVADVNMDADGLIIHSSGSTAFPKPIYWTHRALVWFSAYPCYGEADLTGMRMGCHGIPMSHGMGGVVMAYTVATGMIVTTFKPQAPAVVPNPVNVLEDAARANCDYVYCPPTFLEGWSLNPTYVEYLANMRGAIYGGGPLDKDAGDFLTSKGVNIFVTYASTQAALASVYLPKPPGMDWEYFKIAPHREVHFIDYGKNEFELVNLASPGYRPNVVNTQINGRDAYASSDLVSPHPTKTGYWKVVGRTDDQIIHSTGEKTNPGPLEGALSRDPRVQACVVFGRSRFHCGVIVQPKSQYAFDPVDEDKLADFRNRIWPTIDMMNAYAPTHSRIFKEMILVTSPSKPFTYTVKAMPRRQAIIDDYAQEITALYDAVEQSAQNEIDAPDVWTSDSVRQFVKAIVENTMNTEGRKLLDEADLFDHGCDSLQATWIRNAILRAVRKYDNKMAQNIPLDIVYRNPTISSLSSSVLIVVQGTVQVDLDDTSAKQEELQNLVEKYITEFPQFTSSSNALEQAAHGKRVVLLTGSTGSFGANILARLLASETIKEIIVIARKNASGETVIQRQLDAFRRDGLEVELLKTKPVTFLEGDLSTDDLGISAEKLLELQASVTHIIHSAWLVDFNRGIAAFEASIRSVRKLIDFSLGGSRKVPPRFIFVSSIAVFHNIAPNGAAVEATLVEPDAALGLGYGEAKWVAERVLEEATKRTPLSVVIMRSAQITGGPSGCWPTHGWVPALIKSSVTLGILPDARGTVSWIPGELCASAFLDVLDTEERVLHVAHPKPVPWNTLATYFAKALRLRLVPFHEWLAALEGSNVDGAPIDSIPALSMLPFFRDLQRKMRDESREALAIARLDLNKVMKVSSSLANPAIRRLAEPDVERWLTYWKSIGFLE